MGQTQGKDEGTNNNNDSISPRKDKKDKKKKEKKSKLPVKEQLALKLLTGSISATLQVSKAVDKISDALDPDNWAKKPKLLHDGHFELLPKAKSSVITETSLGLFFCLPNELLVHLSNYLSWKEALSLQASSRGLLLLLDEDLYWKGLYDKVEWKHMTKTDSAEINDYLPLSNSVVSNPTLSPVPQDCCYKKKFFKRYLLPAEKKARTTSQINEMYNRIRKVETKRDAKAGVYLKEFTKEINTMNSKRWMVALFCCILIALFLKPVTIFATKLVIFTCQLPAELLISFMERFSCWRGFAVTCWGFNSRKTFASLDFAIDAGIRNDYLFCMPTITIGCFLQFGIWAVFQIAKLISTFMAFAILAKLSLVLVEKFSQYLLQFRTFSQKEIRDRFNKQKEEVEKHYGPKLKKLRDRVEALRLRPEMYEPRTNARGSPCCIQ